MGQSVVKLGELTMLGILPTRCWLRRASLGNIQCDVPSFASAARMPSWNPPFFRVGRNSAAARCQTLRKYELKLGEIPSLEKKADDDELAWLASTKLSFSTK